MKWGKREDGGEREKKRRGEIVHYKSFSTRGRRGRKEKREEKGKGRCGRGEIGITYTEDSAFV